MPDQLGEQLTKLNHGDPVVVTVEGARYDGEIIETKRQKCEQRQGFMESGAISIRIELSPETVSQYDLPREFISISATEIAPLSWDIPQALVYDPTENKTTMILGTVTEVKIGNSPE